MFPNSQNELENIKHSIDKKDNLAPPLDAAASIRVDRPARRSQHLLGRSLDQSKLTETPHQELEVVQVPVSEINKDPEFHSRAKTDSNHVKDLAETISEWISENPIDVFEIEGVYYVVDGFHRLEAIKTDKSEVDSNGIEEPTIPARIHRGTRQDARYFCYKANRKHGKNPSNSDLKHVFSRALKHGDLTGDDAADSKAVAKLLGCSIRHAQSLNSWHRKDKKQQRDAKIRSLKVAGKSTAEIAVEVEVDKKTVAAVLDREKRNTSKIPADPPDGVCDKSVPNGGEADRSVWSVQESAVRDDDGIKKLPSAHAEGSRQYELSKPLPSSSPRSAPPELTHSKLFSLPPIESHNFDVRTEAEKHLERFADQTENSDLDKIFAKTINPSTLTECVKELLFWDELSKRYTEHDFQGIGNIPGTVRKNRQEYVESRCSNLKPQDCEELCFVTKHLLTLFADNQGKLISLLQSLHERAEIPER